MIGKLLHWFYCLDLQDAALVVAVGTAIFCLLCEKLEHFRWWRWLASCILITLLTVVIYTTLGNRNSSNDLVYIFTPFQSYREAKITGNIEIYRSNFMNVMLFYPAGLLAVTLLPRKWSGWRCAVIVFALCAISAGIEFVQYCYALGRCEIDDIIHNTIGALLGSLAALLFPPFLAFLKKKVIQQYHLVEK